MTKETKLITIATYLREQNFNPRIWDTLNKRNQHIVMEGFTKQAEEILNLIYDEEMKTGLTHNMTIYCQCGHKWDRHEQLLNRSWRCLDCQCRDRMRDPEFDTDRQKGV